MSRVLHLQMTEQAAIEHCRGKDIGISASEALPAGGIRLVCMSVEGAEKARKTLKSKLIKTDMVRERHRPVKPLW